MTSRVSVDNVVKILQTYHLSGMRQLKSGRYGYSIAFYCPKDGRDRLIEQMDSLVLDKETRRTAVVYMGNGFELRVERRPNIGRSTAQSSLTAGPIVLLLTEGHQPIYDRFGKTKAPSYEA